MKIIQTWSAAALLAAASCLSARAGLQIPYTPDADTLHLWHFNDSIANQGTASYVTVTDAVAVANGGITMTNLGLGSGGTPPFTNIFLVTNDAIPALNDSLSILPGDGSSSVGASHAMCAGPSDLPSTAFANNTSGAFTFEAIVNPQGNIFSSAAGSGEWEIFCGDNSAGTRGWQFRLQNASPPVMDFNFITASGGSAVNQTFTLPISGADAVATNQWYHIAVTFTGNSPTNGDPAGVLTFYWTLLDKNRTNADVLGAITNSALGTIGGTPSPAIGGSQRTVHGVGNGGSFQGFIDEVRVSDICRAATNMVFTTNAVVNPPIIGSVLAPSILVGYGQPLNVNVVVLGSQPITYQWQISSTGSGGWSNLSGQTNNALTFAAAAFANSGYYQLVATNSALANNSVTSSVVQVTVGAVPSELFSTGFNTNGVLDTTLAGNPDPHYTLVQSADPSYLGPNAIVWNMSTYPIALNGGGFANIDGSSQWIGTENDSYSSVEGQYTYRTYFVLDTVDTTRPLTISGTWWDSSVGSGILINGQSSGNVGASHSGTGSAAFVITNGFKPGLNTLDFVTVQDYYNTAYEESAVRVEIHGLGYALPAGIPTITTQPASASVHDGSLGGQSEATFAVVASGRPPLSYQWWADGAPLSGATNRTLQFISPTAGGQGTDFSVVVGNTSGSVTSKVAVLTILTTNQPPVAPAFNYTMYSNTTLNVSLDTLYLAASDLDNDPLTISWDGSTTNSVSLSQTGVILAYTPNTDYLGADEFNYYISDAITSTTGAVNINVVPLAAPTAFSAAKSGGNVVLSGSGASAGGAFHILQSTNLAAPLTNWVTVLSTNFNGSGGFSVPLPVSASVPQSYYLIAVP